MSFYHFTNFITFAIFNNSYRRRFRFLLFYHAYWLRFARCAVLPILSFSPPLLFSRFGHFYDSYQPIGFVVLIEFTFFYF